MMKNIFLFLVTLCFIYNNCISQSKKEVELEKQKLKERAELISKIKATTTIVPFKDINSEKAKKYRAVFDKYWNITKIKYVTPKEFDSLVNKPGYSFVHYNSSSIHTDYNHDGSYFDNLTFWMNQINMNDDTKKNQVESINLYFIHLAPDYKTAFAKSETYKQPAIVFGNKSLENNERKRVFSFHFDDDVFRFYNLSPGMMKNFIQQINSLYSDKKDNNIFNNDNIDYYFPEEIKKLKNATLYIPEYCLISQFSLSYGKIVDTAYLFKKYSYRYEVISMDELDKKILSGNGNIYYMLYMQIFSDKYLYVINGSNGKIVYLRWRPTTYVLKSKDIKKIQQAIGK